MAAPNKTDTCTKKIAIFMPSLRGGGTERIMLTLAEGFTGRGYSVDLVLAAAEGPYLSLVPENVRVVDLGASRMITALPKLAGYLRRERPASMLSAMNHVNVVAVWARMLSGARTRLVISERNHLSLSIETSGSIRLRLLTRFMRMAYPRADCIVSVSRGVSQDLAKTLGLSDDNIKVIYNPVVTPDLIESSQHPLDHPWFAPEEPPVILGCGRLCPQKNFSLLIRAFADLRKKRRARLMILGEGELRENLEAIIRELGMEHDISLPGFVSNPYAYMSKSSLFVLSSNWEGLPGVLVQAMACGSPVISTDCPSGPAEILENGKWGRLVPPNDAGALSGAMAEALDEPSYPDVTKRAGDFAADRAIQSYLDTLL
ncbi:MAG: glycosyltransferase [Desulfobacterales bacterium]